MTMYESRELFGGAMKCHIGKEWGDVSTIRQVPDHQECFQQHLGNATIDNNGALLVIEILERQKDITDDDAASYFFYDLADSNGSNENTFQSKNMLAKDQQDIPMMVKDRTICLGTGIQKIAMGRDTDIQGNSRQDQQQEIKYVQVDICVFRLKHVDTDLVLTVSKPIVGPANSSTSSSLNDVVVVDDLSFTEPFERAVSTFQVLDWGLFG
eukprot:scaffold7169_cov107-Cylindrotheca_fusiformis.AAC.2